MKFSIVLFSALCFAASVLAEEPGYTSKPDTRPVKQSAAPHAAPVADPHGGSEMEDEPEPKIPAASAPGQLALDMSITETLCIQEAGRKKPLHTYAAESIEQIVGRPVFAGSPYWKDEQTGERLEALDAFLSIWFHPRHWLNKPLILVSYAPLKRALDLPETRKLFSFEELAKSEKLNSLRSSAHTLRQEGREKELTELQQEAEVVISRLGLVNSIMQGDGELSLVPHPSSETGSWMTLEAMAGSFEGSEHKPVYALEKAREVFARYAAFKESYQRRDVDEFLKASRDFKAALASLSPTVYPGDERLAREVSYNKLRPFGRAWMFYFVAFIVTLFALRFKAKPLYGLAMLVYFAGLGFHVYGFTLRCLIAGRPPVSNMYESVVWVGFGAVFFGLVFELIYKRRYFMLCGAVAGFGCLLLMDLMPVVMGNSAAPGFEAQIKPLLPVLRDNYWLTVHVLTITLSYAAFMLAWVLGHATLGKHLFNPGAKAQQHELHQFVYRVMQVGVLLLACGTILGGAWAYKSWGRFWGWDPKETWAFIALMCYIVALHGRFAGWWGNFGLSVASVACFQAVVMAWYGVNFVLGSGLHAYGAGAGGMTYVLSLIGADVVFTGLAIARYLTYAPPREAIDESQDDPDADAPNLSPGDPVQEVRAISHGS